MLFWNGKCFTFSIFVLHKQTTFQACHLLCCQYAHTTWASTDDSYSHTPDHQIPICQENTLNKQTYGSFCNHVGREISQGMQAAMTALWRQLVKRMSFNTVHQQEAGVCVFIPAVIKNHLAKTLVFYSRRALRFVSDKWIEDDHVF